jgi:hypothetical protein
MVTLAELQDAQQRTRAAGINPGRYSDAASAMAQMRDQGLDPHVCPLALVFGPERTIGSRREPLDRFVFRVEGSTPPIELEVVLLPGTFSEVQWRAWIVRGWVQTRGANFPSTSA